MPRRRRPLLGLFLILLCTVSAPSWAQSDASDLLQTLQAQLAAGRLDEALVTARRCCEVLPGNEAIWYNLAGLEQRHGDRDAAVAALRQAVILGFDDFRFADTDTDLGDLRQDPAYEELRAAWSAGLATRVRERRLTLEAGAWSAPFELVDRRGGVAPPTATASLRVSGSALELSVTMDDHPLGMVPPWLGGSGILVCVTLPEDPTTAEGRFHAEIGVGMADGLPVGAVRLGGRWQRLAELTPKLRRDPESGRLRATFAVPWAVTASLHPLVDTELSLNLTVVRAGRRTSETDETETGRAAWISDPAAGRSDHPWRRGIPVTVRWPASQGPVVQGLPADLVMRDGTVDLSLAALSLGREVTVRLALRDRTGALQEPASWSIPAQKKAPRRQRQPLAVTAPAGSIRLGATLAAATGEPATWETSLLNLPSDWEQRTAARIADAPAPERPSLQYRLTAVTTELAARHPRQSVLALGATVDELEAMLDRVETHGTSVPAGGTYLAAIPAADGQPELLCSLALPDGWQRGDPARAVILLARAPGAEQHAVMRAPRLLAERSAGDAATPAIVMAIPHLAAGHDPGPARQMVVQIMDWLREFTACGPVRLAGVDLLGATALELAGTRPDDVAAALLITGMGFAPYPQLETGTLPADLADLSADASIGWIWFPEELRPGDQTLTLQESLRRHGVTIEPAVKVAGGLGYSQAWSRAILWAADLPQ